MNRRWFCRLLLVCLALAALPGIVPGARADEAATREAMALEIETLFGQLVGSYDSAPVYTEHGDGFYSLSVALQPEARERLLAALGSADAAAKPQTFFVLAAGQQLTPPSTPEICIHAALSNADATYYYWLVALNLGSQSVTRTTTSKLTGPGRKFNRSIQFTYGSNTIWAIWYNPGAGVGQPGLYTFQGSVSGAGSAVAKSFAIIP